MSYPVHCLADFGAHNAGLTVHGKLYDGTGSLVDTITTGVVEIVDGLHWYTLAAPDGHAGAFILYNSADETQRRVFVVAPRETENADVKSSTLATSASLTAVANNVTAILAATGTDGVAIATATMQAIADVVLGRSVTHVEDTTSIYTIAGLILAQFESSALGTTWTIKKTDGATTFATRTLTEDATAKPVTGVS